jgi:transcriptional accessory protein Tex/SPT6
VQSAMHKLGELAERYGVNLVAIGNGKGHREAELLVAQAIKERGPTIEALKTLRYASPLSFIIYFDRYADL